jgi:phospholipase C
MAAKVRNKAFLGLLVLALAGGCSAASRGSTGAASASAEPSSVSAAAGPTTSPSGATESAGGVRPEHVVIVVMENKSYNRVAGDSKAPYLNGLLARSAVFTNSHGVTHPSEPNYLALFSGSTHGVTNDRCPVRLNGQPNLGRQLLDAGLSFTGYSEDLPSVGFGGCQSGNYAAKHNPWVDFDNVPASANQPYTAFPADFGRLPTVSFVVPNLCNDMHDCGTAAGDQWSQAHLAPYLAWADTHNSLLIVTFDENDGASGNQILTLFAGASVRPGKYGESINHYTLLRTIEQLYGLGAIGEAARARPITDVWR